MKQTGPEHISGNITGIGLPSFMQMIEMEQKTCTLKIFTSKDIGYVYFNKGSLVDAKTGALSQLKALYKILSWNNMIIEVEKNVSKTRKLINLPLMHILIESAKQTDEISKNTPPDDLKTAKNQHAKKIPSRSLYDENFCLEIGTKLLIDFDNISIPFQSKLVGMEHGKYLVVKAPEPIGGIHYDFSNVDPLIVKTLYKGTVYAFQSKLKTVISTPSKLMFINYPQKIEHLELRSHKRYKCSIVTQTEVDHARVGGVIENISRGGCLCTLENVLTDENLSFNLVNRAISLNCYFPGTKKKISLLGEVKNLKEKSDEMVLGVEFIFQDNSPKVKDIVNKYIDLIEYSSEYV